MAETATIYQFSIDLSDMDRGVYDTLELRVARHPSETAEYMVVRVLAYCLEYQEGIMMTEGVSSGDEPALLAVPPHAQPRTVSGQPPHATPRQMVPEQ